MNISKFLAPSSLGHYAFLYRINFFGARNWLLLNENKWRTWKADIAKIIIIFENKYCKNNYNFWKQVWLLTIFPQCSIRCLTGLWICPGFWVFQGSVYTCVLNMAGFYIYFCFWICQKFEYTRVLNMLGLNRVLGMAEYFLGMPFTLFS